MSVSGIISNISRGSLHDGSGVRTVVYFKGCPMRCKWCHNPETFTKRCDIVFAVGKCIGCGDCVRICPECHVVSDGKLTFVREKCTGCGRCADACVSGALSLCGEKRTSEEVFSQILKDSHYFTQSGGGVTLSGGECLAQPDFAADILEKCRKNSINTAIESAFYVPFTNIERVLPFTDHVFADIKHHDADIHRQYTGASNELITDNIKKVSEIHPNITLRIPLIPGVNDSEADMAGFGKVIRQFGSGIKGVELLRYNYLASAKYGNLGLEYVPFGSSSQSDRHLEMLKTALEQCTDGKFKVFYV